LASSRGNGAAGSTNTGSGGGGGANDGGGNGQHASGNGGNGGKGVVIVRHSDAFAQAASTTGSPTITTSGGQVVYVFNDSGSIEW
jgi:hypothetical protein